MLVITNATTGQPVPYNLVWPDHLKYLPKTIPPLAPQNPDIALERLLDLKTSLTGNFTFPPSALLDLRFRLVQVHEFMHAFCYRFRKEIAFSLRMYLAGTAKAWKGGPVVLAPLTVTDGSPRPPNFKRLVKREGDEVGYLPMSAGDAAISIVASQYEELLVDFLCSAAAGAAYWTTMLDFEEFGDDSKTMFRSPWNTSREYLYDPHPPTAARFVLLPKIFLQVFSRDDGMSGLAPDETQALLAGMGQHIQQHVSPRFPVLSPASEFIFENQDAPAELQEIRIPADVIERVYHSVFLGFSSMLKMWLAENHPLSVFRWWFFSTDYHRRIADLAQEFATSTPAPVKPDGYFFDSFAGAAGARLCFDQNRSQSSQGLQERAKRFQQQIHKVIVPLSTELPEGN